MVRKFLFIGIVLSLILGLGFSMAFQAGLFPLVPEKSTLDIGYPVLEGVEETIVEEMPVPGNTGVNESVVSSGMPVPGYEGIKEMIIDGE